jgi:hypothetical protein
MTSMDANPAFICLRLSAAVSVENCFPKGNLAQNYTLFLISVPYFERK